MEGKHHQVIVAAGLVTILEAWAVRLIGGLMPIFATLITGPDGLGNATRIGGLVYALTVVAVHHKGATAMKRLPDRPTLLAQPFRLATSTKTNPFGGKVAAQLALMVK